MSNLTLSDFFCGAGGSSTGALDVPGVDVRAAANHWDLAVETHQRNHPDAEHICADISQYEPSLFPHTDLAWFSPSCTSHTVAQGMARADRAAAYVLGETPLPDDAHERSRATMWDVVRFTEYHHYAAVIVENVTEVTKWAPFPAWIMAMEALGYKHRIVMLNSMHAGLYGPAAAQSRDRFYCVFWQPDITDPDLDAVVSPQGLTQAFKKGARHVGKYGAQYVYVDGMGRPVEPKTRPAADIIDWSDRGTPIGARKRPLRPKTMAKIQAGINKHWATGDTTPFIAELRGGGSSTRSAHDPLSTVTASGTHHGLVMSYYGNGTTQTTGRPMPTVTTVEKQALLTGRTTRIDDVRFRMMSDRELATAMMFPADYDFAGTKRERVRMIGNAVTCNAARDIIGQVVKAVAA